MKADSELDRLIALGVKISRGLAHHEAKGRLSARAMLAQALELAHCTETRLDEIETKLATMATAGDPIKRVVARFSRELRNPQWAEVPRDASKVLRIYSSDRDALAQSLHECDALACEVVALSVREAVKQFSQSFGRVEEPVRHRLRMAELREELQQTCDAMRRSWSQADVEPDPRISPELRDQGFTRLRFKRFPSIHLLPESNWPMELVNAAMAKPVSEAPQDAKAEGEGTGAQDPAYGDGAFSDAARQDETPIRRRRVSAALQSS